MQLSNQQFDNSIINELQEQKQQKLKKLAQTKGQQVKQFDNIENISQAFEISSNNINYEQDFLNVEKDP